MDSVKQSAALCLLRLYKASPDLVPMGEWTARVVHLLNDQHMVRPRAQHLEPPACAPKPHPCPDPTWKPRAPSPLSLPAPRQLETLIQSPQYPFPTQVCRHCPHLCPWHSPGCPSALCSVPDT